MQILENPTLLKTLYLTVFWKCQGEVDIHGKNMRGDPPKSQNLFTKIVFIPTCLNFSHFQSTLHLMQYTYQDIFFYCSKQFLNSSILIPFSASAGFLFHLFYISKMFPFEDIFHLGKQTTKKVARGKMG